MGLLTRRMKDKLQINLTGYFTPKKFRNGLLGECCKPRKRETLPEEKTVEEMADEAKEYLTTMFVFLDNPGEGEENEKEEETCPPNDSTQKPASEASEQGGQGGRQDFHDQVL